MSVERRGAIRAVSCVSAEAARQSVRDIGYTNDERRTTNDVGPAESDMQPSDLSHPNSRFVCAISETVGVDDGVCPGALHYDVCDLLRLNGSPSV